MNEDKKIDPKDLPQTWERTTTKQPEEFIDPKSTEKESTDVPVNDHTPKETRSAEDAQKSGN